MTDVEKDEWLRCYVSPLYFIHNFCQLYDATLGEWIPFHLWREQAGVVNTFLNNRLVIVLKARQLGMTWLVLAFALWLMLFRPIATILLFSKRDDEAVYMLGIERLRGMYARLPKFLHARGIVSDNDHEWMLSNSSIARAFPTSAGDSYTATLAFVDETDLVPDLQRLMSAVKPTIDGGGRMILLSRANKSAPQSMFKRIYHAARQGSNGWTAVFLPWWVRPERDQKWYEAQKRDILARTNALDDLHEQYPASDAEALSPRSLDKRIHSDWLEQCYYEASLLLNEQKLAPEVEAQLPALPGLTIYRLPEPGHRYVIGADPAEGNPTSDDSAFEILDRATGEEVACLACKLQPEVFGAHINAVGMFYNRADALVERNNHGHAVLLWLRDNSALRRLNGSDDKEGWHSTSLGNAMLYDNAATAFREGETILHNLDTFTQLSQVEGSTLSAPEGEHDDRADAYALALMARVRAGSRASVDWV